MEDDQWAILNMKALTIMVEGRVEVGDTTRRRGTEDEMAQKGRAFHAGTPGVFIGALISAETGAARENSLDGSLVVDTTGRQI